VRQENENVIVDYRRLSKKHKVLVAKVEQGIIELTEAHATELVRVKEELDKETQGYTDYA
jgi:hypothetical protein